MIQDRDRLGELTPEEARYGLAETKLKLMNLMSHLEFLETRLVDQERPSPAPDIVIHYIPESIPNRNPA